MSANREISAMFERLATAIQMTGENAFKAIAFQKVARVLDELDIDVLESARGGNLPEIEGVGASSRRIIEQYAKEGRSDDYEHLVGAIPQGLFEVLRIPGLGPKTVATLWKQKNIESVQQLELAISEGRLSGIKGLGDKKISSMLDGIRLLKAGMERRGLMDVMKIADQLVSELKSDTRVGAVEMAGSFRRRRETVGDLDLICWVHRPADAEIVINDFCARKSVEKVLACGGTKGSILVEDGFQIDLRIVPKSSYGAALQYFTGSKEHNVKLRGLAQDKGFTLNEWGLYRVSKYQKSEKKGEASEIASIAGADEKGIYEKLGLCFIPPELREDRGEIEAAIQGSIPRIIEADDIKGDLHLHTTASDGINTIEQMADAAKKLGYQYIAITDHSHSSVIANGLDDARLRAHIKAIRNAKVAGITILAGSEVDILADGRLDYDDGLLRELDIVVASPHASLKQDTSKATDRLLRAIDSRYVNIIGHPTGRMINQREGLLLDMGKIIERAASTGTALEINAGWPRWDLNDTNARRAAQGGAMLVVNTDSHATQSYVDMQMGLWIARRAWLLPRQVLNCLDLADVKEFLVRKR